MRTRNVSQIVKFALIEKVAIGTRLLIIANNVTFHCDILSGTPRPEVTWWFGWTDTAKQVDVQYDSRYSHPTDEKWTITGIETKDVGKYRCRAKNTAGEDYLRIEITAVDSMLF